VRQHEAFEEENHRRANDKGNPLVNDCYETSDVVNDTDAYSIKVSCSFSQVMRHDILSATASPSPVDYRFSPMPGTHNVAFISKSNVTCHTAEKAPPLPRDHIADCDTLTKMELRRRYPQEENSHRNMLYRRKTEGALIHPDLYEFRSFLRILGPKPARGVTVERTNNDDREYAPAKVCWADKRTQNSNKGDSHVFFEAATGQSVTTSQLARRQGVSPAAIRKRLERGWKDNEIVAGKTHRIASVPSPRSNTAGMASSVPKRRELTWAEREFASTAATYREQREEDCTEAFLPTYEFCKEFRAECGLPYSEEEYEGYVRRLWPQHRPHLNYFNPTLPESQRQLIAKIDPGYVQRITAERAARSNLKEVL
jgi:hypothetical protein